MGLYYFVAFAYTTSRVGGASGLALPCTAGPSGVEDQRSKGNMRELGET